ncbi:MAG: universal stress protein [Rhodocyclaceae bacterium]|nr:universal stress protein [Rhodocyclaceae bacterium]MCO5095894.1 universal stress protein [Rhodocyclaceae bacterium]
MSAAGSASAVEAAAALSMTSGLAPRILLLAHHGTAGAERAAELALSLAVPGHTRIVHLYVVPDFWDGMQGDDWLNNAWTRDTFARHVEGQLQAEANAQLRAVADRCETSGIQCEAVLRYGKPAECLLDAVRECGADLVVIGPPRPKGTTGLRSRMDLDRLARGLTAPLLIAR